MLDLKYYIGVILGLYWAYIGIMEKENGNYRDYRGCIYNLDSSQTMNLQRKVVYSQEFGHATLYRGLGVEN